jgi:hypothetical protein
MDNGTAHSFHGETLAPDSNGFQLSETDATPRSDISLICRTCLLHPTDGCFTTSVGVICGATSTGHQTERLSMIKSLLGFVCATALLIAVAQAQTYSPSTTTTQSTTGTTTTTGTTGSETTTTTTENFGTVTEFTPGSSLVLSTGSGEPVRYRFSKTVTYVTPEGKVIDASRIKKDSKVRVHYVKEGNDMLVDKVIVTGND